MKICWYFDTSQTLLWHEVAERFRKQYGIEQGCGVVIGTRWKHWLARRGYAGESLALVTDELERSLRLPPDVDYLREIESKYGNPNLWLSIVADRVIIKKPLGEILKALEIHYRFFEKFLDGQKPHVMVSGDVASLAGYACYQICRDRGIPYYQVVYGRVKNRVAIVQNLDGRWEKVERLYGEIKGRSLGPEERAAAVRFLEEFRRGYVEISPLKSSWARPKWVVDWGRFARYLRDHYLVGRGKDYFEPSLKDYLVSRLNRLSRFYGSRALRYFEEPVSGERYVFFPLHFQPEASTMVRAPFYLNQVALIENIARSMPIDCYLYVKEHPRSLGTRPLSDYKAIRRLPNVRLISPLVDGRELLKKAKAVTVITGTAGWEGLLLGKPVLTFGKVFYNIFESVFPVRDVYRLPAILFSALTEFHHDEERLLKFVIAFLGGTYPGEIANPQGWPVLTEENVANLSRALALELGLEQPDASAGAGE